MKANINEFLSNATRWHVEYLEGDIFDLNTVFEKGDPDLDKQLARIKSCPCGRRPMLVWRASPRKPWLAIATTENLGEAKTKYSLIYGEWRIVALDTLIQKMPDSFWRETL